MFQLFDVLIKVLLKIKLLPFFFLICVKNKFCCVDSLTLQARRKSLNMKKLELFTVKLSLVDDFNMWSINKRKRLIYYVRRKQRHLNRIKYMLKFLLVSLRFTAEIKIKFLANILTSNFTSTNLSNLLTILLNFPYPQYIITNLFTSRAPLTV